MNDPVSKLSFHKRVLSLITPSYPCVCAVARWRIFQTPRYSYAHEQLQAVTLFITHNSSTLYWQLEVKMAFIQHKARAHSMPIKSAAMIPNTLRQRKQCGLMRCCRWIICVGSESQMWTYFAVKDHLVSFSVFDLIVEVLWKLQALVDLSLEPDGALLKRGLLVLTQNRDE